MSLKPVECGWSYEYLNKINNFSAENSTFLVSNEEEALKYLKWWNRTNWNGASTIDIIDYEKLIYIEMKFGANEEIKNLIKILKEKIMYSYELRKKYMDNIIDTNLYKDVKYVPNLQTRGLNLYSFLNKEDMSWS